MARSIMTCGHEDPYRQHGWPIAYWDWGERGDRVIFYASFCHDCYLRTVRDYPEDILFPEDEDFPFESEED